MSFSFNCFLIVSKFVYFSLVANSNKMKDVSKLLNVSFSILDPAILQNRISLRKIRLLHQSDVYAEGTIKIKIY